ncbi:hypothetical protein HPB52_016106 [Rhipicephalus sanguineus]|uniref:Uncharacterized protein n=1 Tax=Rhipicephalus sanguineus TaxID=34632 RepID=A0A9D4PX22_RHISA|nr:hypothetical protein HPB52_016106 [Rhipicephalus sanguineus]
MQGPSYKSKRCVVSRMPLNVNEVEYLAEEKLAEMRREKREDLRKWLLLQAILARARRLRRKWEVY